MTKIQLNNISKRYTRKFIFKDISSEVYSGELLVLKGHNGSGKSTLLKTISYFAPTTTGEVNYYFDDTLLTKSQSLNLIGFNAPYFNLFNDLTAIENIQVLLKSKNITLTSKEIHSKLDQFQLNKKGHVQVHNYSSGMKQRIKLLCAMLFEPIYLFLDEPTSNLDQNGKDLVQECIQEQKKRGITIICTNESNEVEWGDKIIDLTN